MAHFAELDANNIVVNVLVVNNEVLHDGDLNEQEQLGIDFLVSLYGEGSFVQTSYNGNFRKNYAGKGFTYDSVRDAFIPPQPFASWTLNEETCLWEAPVSTPTFDPMTQTVKWDESNLQWVVE